jgi:predicted ATP-binding protein involved in virulence
MVIKQLHLKNFRLFNDIKVDFTKQLNVFIGVNGAGKSALLDAIAIMLSSYVSRLTEWKEIYGNMYYIQDTDIQYDKKNVEIEIAVQDKANLWSWQMTSAPNKANINSIKKIATQLTTELSENPLKNIPVLVYYGYKRANSSKRKTAFKVNYAQLLAYRNGLNPTIDSFNDFEEWFIDEEGFEDKIRLEKDNTFRSPKLEVIRNVLYSFFNKMGTSRYSNLKVKKDRRLTIYSALVIHKDNKELELSQLSAGEKMILSMVIDIAHRLTLANPSLENPIQGNGVVLIDEIDLHLHPQWQQTIVQALIATFPNIQFIITTHSPLVLSNISKEYINIIEDGQIEHNLPNTFGKDANHILNQIFKTDERTPDIKHKLQECSRLLDKGETEKGKLLLDELIKILGEDDPDIVEAKTFLHFYAD